VAPDGRRSRLSVCPRAPLRTPTRPRRPRPPGRPNGSLRLQQRRHCLAPISWLARAVPFDSGLPHPRVGHPGQLRRLCGRRAHYVWCVAMAADEARSGRSLPMPGRAACRLNTGPRPARRPPEGAHRRLQLTANGGAPSTRPGAWHRQALPVRQQAPAGLAGPAMPPWLDD